jgi:CheY-like chemotaxis protein
VSTRLVSDRGEKALRVLVVEDDRDLNRQLVSALTDAGYAVDAAFDGEEGFFLGDTEPYDVVILDTGLPKMDGIRVLEQWRRSERKMPVIILTARDRWSDKVTGMDAGADDYVAKPFHMEELLARIRAQVRRASGHAKSDLECGPLRLDRFSPAQLADHGQRFRRNPAVVALADRLGRGSNSVAMKLSNFASLDPALKLRGIRGLDSTSVLDRTVWNDFHTNLNEAAPTSEAALRQLFRGDERSEIEVLPKEGVRVRKRPPTGPTETTATVKQRRGQEYFRDAVLNNFGGRCGVTQLDVRELLIASHILPWGTHIAERLSVQNGLCLRGL